jgi:hypothetical protein
LPYATREVTRTNKSKTRANKSKTRALPLNKRPFNFKVKLKRPRQQENQ